LNIFDDEGPIDISIIEDFEKSIGCDFPEQYKSLLSQYNALVPEENIFSYSFSGDLNDADVSFFGFNLRSDETIEKVQQKEYGRSDVVVFGGTANGDFVCFDYRNSRNQPAVVIMLHDVFDKENRMAIVEVSKNFDDFISSLKSLEE
jgi:hypothetical protein